MNYTYLPHSTTNLPPGPLIIMTSNPASKKTLNLLQNPNVSLLVHDWVSSRPPNVTERDRSPTGARSSSLANMLMQLNSAAVSSISATINGEATVLESGTEEEKWCKEAHLKNNTFEEGNGRQEGANSYLEDDDVRVVVVRIRDGRISDWKGGVKDFCLSEATGADGEGEGGLVNGVRG
jgi:hypothetical protein